MSEECPRNPKSSQHTNKLLSKLAELSKGTTTWLWLLIISMAAYIAYQQAQIDELATRVYGQYNMSDMDSFDYRITNLEHISNAHAARLKVAEKDIWQLQKETHAFQWRLMQLEWLHPELAVPQETPTKPDLKDFTSNPGRVPNPLQPGESIFNEETP
ncbi:hypothetical protein [Veillonella criceti]|uniref:Uncharacterized protein n=1 Tax=Veillonella criceti TaxID=103891 RepID=A0A380NNA0_9FIRM|nr:hypothetical protein [Veillonella criceti]SUP44839.1 Uncharacterised protein [Veillonella criceti]